MPDATHLNESLVPPLLEVVLSKTKPGGHVLALSFFSGAMGLDLGLEQAGLEVVTACEWDQACRMTIKRNRPELTVLSDVLDYTAREVREFAGLTSSDDIDLVVGGPPCQAFSTAGARRGFEDSRGNVFLHFLDLVLELNPRYFVIENVRGLLSAPLRHRPHSQRGPGHPALSSEELPGGALAHILRKLTAGGYEISFNLYNAANFGVPQKRERVILIGSRDTGRVGYLRPTHAPDERDGLLPWRTFHDAVSDLKDPGPHLSFSEKRLRFFRLLKPGQNWRDLPDDLQRDAMGKSFFSGGGKTGFFRRLAWDAPSPTLVTHPAMPATDLAHPEEDRPLSIAEYKRIQMLPDDWALEGSLVEQYRQIGNAVPVGLGAAVGRDLMAHDSGERWHDLEFPYSRYRKTSDRDWLPPHGSSERDLRLKAGDPSLRQMALPGFED